MAEPSIDIGYVARLARMDLTAEEARLFGAQLGEVLAYVRQLEEVDVSGIEPTAHPAPLLNVARPDEVRPSLDHEWALRNAPAQENGLFLVPRIVE